MLRTCVLCCAMMGAVGLVIGCTPSKDTTKPTVKKDEAITGFKNRLSGDDKRLEELKAKVDKATGEEKARLETKFKDATAKRDAAKKKLDELEKAATEKWEAVSKEVETALDELKKAVD